MKKLLIILAATLQMSVAFAAGDNQKTVKVGNTALSRQGGYMELTTDIALEDLDVPSNRAVVITPMLVKGDDCAEFNSVTVYGRTRYYYYKRNDFRKDTRKSIDQPNTVFRTGDTPETLSYSSIAPYAEWMADAELVIRTTVQGCCNTVLGSGDDVKGKYVIPSPFVPEFIYIAPEVDSVKVRYLSGQAYVDFPVDKTVIYPEYRRNTVELGKIVATIDTVRNDSDVTITKVSLKGFASPESPYSHNSDLAKGRVAALKTYVRNLYHFDDNIIVTDYEPEDWEGLRRYVEASTLIDRAEILEIIDCDLAPDPKEWKIKKEHPASYKFLLENCYPALRHTDYVIEYKVKQFANAEDILEVMNTRPQNLSLNEFFIAASSFEQGSEEFMDVYETAARWYPDSEIANLNAAQSSLSRGDKVRAARYLAKSGDNPEANYARGTLAIMDENWAEAANYMQKALSGGLEAAATALDYIGNHDERFVPYEE